MLRLPVQSVGWLNELRGQLILASSQCRLLRSKTTSLILELIGFLSKNVHLAICLQTIVEDLLLSIVLVGIWNTALYILLLLLSYHIVNTTDIRRNFLLILEKDRLQYFPRLHVLQLKLELRQLIFRVLDLLNIELQIELSKRFFFVFILVARKHALSVHSIEN